MLFLEPHLPSSNSLILLVLLAFLAFCTLMWFMMSALTWSLDVVRTSIVRSVVCLRDYIRTVPLYCTSIVLLPCGAFQWWLKLSGKFGTRTVPYYIVLYYCNSQTANGSDLCLEIFITHWGSAFPQPQLANFRRTWPVINSLYSMRSINNNRIMNNIIFLTFAPSKSILASERMREKKTCWHAFRDSTSQPAAVELHHRMIDKVISR